MTPPDAQSDDRRWTIRWHDPTQPWADITGPAPVRAGEPVDVVPAENAARLAGEIERLREVLDFSLRTIKDPDLTEGEIIGCRRCPVAYHEECLPLALSTTRHQHFGKRVWIAGIDEAGERKVDANGGPSFASLSRFAHTM